MSNLFEKAKEYYWSSKYIPSGVKDNIYYEIRKLFRGSEKRTDDKNAIHEYIKQVLHLQYSSPLYQELDQYTYYRDLDDGKILAYYLPQFYPTPYNDRWWGKGTTEWRNVSKGMPQYVGHYQPRLPGELGFYDLRIIDNIQRQIELAKYSGIYGFCFYYYWFDGVRLLDKPVDLFVASKFDFPFCFCWANENWSKQWFGTSDEPLIVQSKTKDSYKNFIKSLIPYLKDDRYIDVNGKKLIIIYRPKNVPNVEEVLSYWRREVQVKLGIELYIVAAMNDTYESYRECNFISKGFDAISEFCLGPQRKYFKDIKDSKHFVCEEFSGNIYDYVDYVENKRYFSERINKMYRAISPMWDNSARKVNKGIILDGSTPQLYQQWLEDILLETVNRVRDGELDDNLVFVNAWNEWSEGAYLEPDLKFGYGYLNATLHAIINTRKVKYEKI